MREIKFRLRNRENKIIGYEKWYSGSWNPDGYWIAKPQWLYSIDNKYWAPAYYSHAYKDSFTGLLDKNGKEIYEGDIIESQGEYSFPGPCVVEWFDDRASFGVATKRSNGTFWLFEDMMDEMEYIEIIGNIYENPNLLNQTPGKGEEKTCPLKKPKTF